jgi:hypothetical protein
MPTCIYAKPGYCTYYKNSPKCDEDCSYFLNKEEDKEEDKEEEKNPELTGFEQSERLSVDEAFNKFIENLQTNVSKDCLENERNK